MSKRELKLAITPITENTFKRQGWHRHIVGDELDMEYDDIIDEIYYYTLPLPKNRVDEYTPMLVSNASDETGLLKEFGLHPGTFFVELMGTDGLGYCASEEELDILYKVLTGDDIEYKN
jgi:hypothetical protein